VRELRGDALLAEFGRASDAVTAALAFQADQLDYLAQLNDSIRPTLRVGIAMGEVVIADDTLTGAGVVLAQRLEQLAESGSVVIQGAAYETIPGRFPFEYDNMGEHQVKGFDEPVRAYEARLKGDTDLPKPSPTVHRTRNTLIAFASVAVVAAGVALMWFKPWEVREEPASIERMAFPLPDKPSIAVLPFDNLSGDPEQEYLGKGLTENIITELSRFKFFVIDRKSSFAYKDESPKIRQVAEELGVRYVVEGSVQISGDTARVTVQLIDAISGRHLWAERFDRDLQDIFEVQDEITRTIAATVKQNIRLAEFDHASRKPIENLSAYEYRTRGMAQWVKFTREGNEQAKQLVEKALTLDPNYSEAYVGLAWVHINGYRWGWSETYSREESLSLAFEMATRAVELDPFNYKTHMVLAKVWMYRGDLDQAIAEYDRARELNPNAADVLMSSSELLVYLGRAGEAISQLNTAIRINPRHPDTYLWSLAWAQYIAEQYEDALASLRKMNKMPNGARRTLAAVLMRLGRVEEARAVIAEFLTNEPEYNLEDMKVWPSKHKEYLERWTEDLRKAGVPEHPPLKLPDKPS
jgi:TolB-like protein/Tfp pilus assembly protein PilF